MGIMINEDCNHFLASRLNIIESVDEEYLKGFIDQYADTLVTDFIMNTSATLSFVPSKTRQFSGDKYLAKTEMGKAVDYTATWQRACYHLWYEKKLDMYQIWIDRCREKGINPWITFRMNDAELFNMPNLILSDYYYEHAFDYARVRHREPRDPVEMCRDYEIEDFRNYQLHHIEELVNRYDVYGVELDFQREIFCFAIGKEWDNSGLMLDFVSKVRQIVNKAGERYSHNIKLSIRCHANPEDSLELGFDIGEMAKRGLIDMIVPSPNWLTCDNSMPLKLWRQLVEPYGVKVVPCLERHLNSCKDYYEVINKEVNIKGLRKHSWETLCASAVNVLSQTDGDIYLFNHMDLPETMEARPGLPSYTYEEYQRVLNNLSSLEKLVNLPRRHIVTYNDTTLPWKNPNGILPVSFDSKSEIRYIKIDTGIIPYGAKCTLRLGINKDADLKVYVNSRECEYMGKCECEEPILTESVLYVYEIPFEAMQKQTQVAEIIASDMVIDYADICVNYK